MPDDSHPESLPARWLVFSLPAPVQGRELELAEELRALGARALERDGDRVLAYVPADPPPEPPDTLNEKIGHLADRLGRNTGGRITWSWRTHQAQAKRWEEHASVLRISPDLVVAPAGIPLTEEEGQVVVRIEPGPAFGARDHPTSRGALLLMKRLVARGEKVLDVGTGSGVLAITALLVGAAEAVAVDRDPVACAAARRNGVLNGVAERLRVTRAEVTPDSRLPARGVHGIVANLDGDALLGLLPVLRPHLRPGGWLVVAGLSTRDRRIFQAEAEAVDLRLVDETWEEGWWSAALRH